VLDRDPQGAVLRWHNRGNGLCFNIHGDLKAQLGAAIDARRTSDEATK
jgi:hypothetical protein